MTEKPQEKYIAKDLEVFEARAPGVPAPVVQGVGPMEIMMEAVQRGQGKEVLEQLQNMFEFQRKIEALENEKKHAKAFADFKKSRFDLIKDKINKHAENSPYVSAGQLLGVVNPELAKFDLVANFEVTDSEDFQHMTVACVLRHELGHSIKSSMGGKIETTGPKGNQVMTEMHARLSCLTYLMKATFSAVVGIAAMDSKFDDDGNAAGGKVKEYITEAQQKTIAKRLKKIYGDDASMFFDWLGCETVDTITDYAKAKKGLDGAEAAMAKTKSNEDESRLGE